MQNTHQTAPDEGAKLKSESFDVFGMTCAACQANVTRAVSKLDGVQSADVSLLSNSMKVRFDPDKVDEKAIEQAVSAIGYEAAAKNQRLNESQPNSIQAEWDARQARIREEIHEKKQALIVSLILLVILMCFSMLPMLGIMTFWMDMKWMMVSSIMQLVLCLIILFFQRSFFVHGFKALFKGAPNMDSLVAIGSSASFLYGMYGILRMAYGYGVMDHAIIHSAMDALYFEGAAMIVTLVSLGKYLEARSKAKTGDALGKLIDLAPKTAVIEKNGVEIQVAADQVTSGDLVVIRPGQRIPVDGIVSSGTGYVDQAAITGESIPVEKQPGDSVLSATINVNGSFKFEATKVGSDTTLAQIIRLVDEAGNSKAPIARLADKVAGVFVPVVMLIALATFVIWMIAGKGFGFALSNAICVLVISCPCALGLATPLAIMVSTGKAAEYGVLIKSAEALETLHSIQTVVLDKTGTITTGKPVVTGISVLQPGLSEQDFLQLAAEVETGSEHPLGKAVVEKARQQGLRLENPDSFEALGGRGLRALIHGNTISAGNRAFMDEEGIALSGKALQAMDDYASKGMTPLLFGENKQLMGVIAVADTVRPASRAALQAMKDLGLQTVMLTGDNEKTAKAIAAGLPIDRIISDVLPADKESVIASLQKEGYKTAMVGDGINDAPALARADVGIAIGAGTDIAIESADVVLMKDDLMDVVTAIELSRKTITNIKENLFWAFFYNCLGIPVAMGALYPIWGWLLNPMWGAAAMSFSSITVCLNALRLRFFKPAHGSKSASANALVKKNDPAEVSSEAVRQEEQKLAELPDTILEQAKNEEQNSTLLRLGGLSCEHCVMHVKEALEKVPGVTKAIVSLDPMQALVLGDANPEALIQAVQEAGYEASLTKPENKPAEQELSNGQPADPVSCPLEQEGKPSSVTLQIGGMMCEHCVMHVAHALEEAAGVTSARVSLNPSEAVVTGKDLNPDALIQAVQEAGYEASVKENAQAETSPAQKLQTEPKTARPAKEYRITAEIKGMMCENCVAHVSHALADLDGIIKTEVSLEKQQAVLISLRPIPADAIRKAVEDAGYEAGTIHEQEEIL